MMSQHCAVTSNDLTGNCGQKNLQHHLWQRPASVTQPSNAKTVCTMSHKGSANLCLQAIEFLHLSMSQFETKYISIGLLVRWIRRLESQHVTLLENPFDGNLVGAHSVSCSDFLDCGVPGNVTRLTTAAQGRKGLNVDALLQTCADLVVIVHQHIKL